MPQLRFYCRAPEAAVTESPIINKHKCFLFFCLRLQSEEARANIDPQRRVCNSSRGSCAGGIVKLGNLKSISYVPLPLILSMNGGEAGGGVRAAEGGE